MKKVFISHPFADNPALNLIKVDNICKKLVETGEILPISPLHAFSYMGEDTYREDILDACFRLIEACDEVFVFGESEGCRLEAAKARLIGKKVTYFQEVI